MCELIELLGPAECLQSASYEEMVRYGEAALACDVALLDVNLGPGVPSGIDAHRWLHERGYRGQVVFLTGHARTHPLVVAARQLPNVRVLEKPVPASLLEDLARDD